MRNASGHPVAVFTALGIVSGIISGQGSWLPMLYAPALLYGLPPDNQIPLRQAVVFGLALAIGAAITATRRIGPLLVIAVSVFAGWWVVMEFAGHFEPGESSSWLFRILYWAFCGFVGALFVAIGGMLAGLYERDARNLTMIVLAGALMGPLTLVGTDYFMPVFIGWQTAVAAAIGLAVARAQPAPVAVAA